MEEIDPKELNQRIIELERIISLYECSIDHDINARDQALIKLKTLRITQKINPNIQTINDQVNELDKSVKIYTANIDHNTKVCEQARVELNKYNIINICFKQGNLYQNRNQL